MKAKGLTEEQRLANLEALKAIGKMCKERGIELTLGIWQQLPWIKSFIKTREDQPVYVEGLDGSKFPRDFKSLAGVSIRIDFFPGTNIVYKGEG